MSAQDIRAVQTLFEAFNTGNAALAENVLAPDYLNYEALDDEEARAQRRGPAEFAASLQWLQNAFSELHFEIQEIIAAEEGIVVRAVMTGKQTGPFMQFAPTGRAISSEQVHIFHLVGGKITEHRARHDDLGMLFQLGAIRWNNPQDAL